MKVASTGARGLDPDAEGVTRGDGVVAYRGVDDGGSLNWARGNIQSRAGSGAES
jgi:hypothetical protein